MRVRLSELEKEQLFMKQGMMDKTGNGKTFLTSIPHGHEPRTVLPRYGNRAD